MGINFFREVEEESGLEVEQPKYVGYIEYQILSRMHETLEVYVFVTDSFKGEIRECDGELHFFFVPYFPSYCYYIKDILKNIEIRPEWFDIDKLPYGTKKLNLHKIENFYSKNSNQTFILDKMWKDNYLWHQLLFENKKFKAYFLYHGDEETVIDYFIEQTENLE